MHDNIFRILIVEGVTGQHTELEEYLRGTGYSVERLATCSLHPYALNEGAPQLVLLDLSSLGGSSLSDQLKALSALTGKVQVPVIILAPDGSLEFELLDVYDYLSKPLDLHRLQTDIERLIALPAVFPERTSPEASTLELFRSFIGEHSGLHFSQRNNRILEQGLQRRMCAVGAENCAVYYNYLISFSKSRNELKKLLSLLTVGETSFFRYSNHRETFVEQLIPDLMEKNRQSRTLKIWSAGCSTGEEPYGISMLLTENFPQLKNWKIDILATDINKRSLRSAREGIYGRRAVRFVEPNYLKRYFTQVAGLNAVKPEVKQPVRFEYLNLKDRFPSSIQAAPTGFDIIFCRNVMIYFETETTRQIVDRFADSLNPGGYLLLGHSETLQNISKRFQRRHYERSFFYQLTSQKKEDVKHEVTDQPEIAEPVVAVNVNAGKTVCDEEKPNVVNRADLVAGSNSDSGLSIEQLFENAESAFYREDFSAAENDYTAVLDRQPSHLGALIGKGLSRANQGDYAAASKFCAEAEKIDDLSPDVYFLRGMISDMESRSTDAIIEYQKVLWLDPCFIVAHYALYRLYRQGGDQVASRRALLNSVRCLEKTPPSAQIHFSGGMTREVFLELCRHDLDTFAD
jgi:chemotaxis protein methyltransferase CheR